MPERRMGMAMGQDCELLGEVCGWINSTATVPVWAKMTPNITDITQVGYTTVQPSLLSKKMPVYYTVAASYCITSTSTDNTAPDLQHPFNLCIWAILYV